MDAQAALTFGLSKGHKEIILLGHSEGTALAMDLVVNNPKAPISTLGPIAKDALADLVKLLK